MCLAFRALLFSTLGQQQFPWCLAIIVHLALFQQRYTPDHITELRSVSLSEHMWVEHTPPHKAGVKVHTSNTENSFLSHPILRLLNRP